MLTIYKHQIDAPLGEHFNLPIPATAKILDVQVQHGVPVLWALIDIDHDIGNGRDFIIFGTGDKVSPVECKYVGTFQTIKGVFVWHLFEVPQ